MSKSKSTFEQRYEAVMQAKQGIPLDRLQKQYHICPSTLKHLINRYDKYGSSGLQEKMVSYYPEKTKLAILREYETNGLSLSAICDKYDLYRKTFNRWLKQYEAYKQGDKFALNGNGATHQCDIPYSLPHVNTTATTQQPQAMPESKEKQERRKALSKLTKKELQELLLDREAELDILKNLEALARERENTRRAILRGLSKD